MDSFIFNEINSTIMGIVINSMPVISKPSKRTNIVTIDGRDGDIIEELGYQAYDMEFTITRVTEDPDINKLIKWLNGKGQLILSTEPDKYYNAEIIEQIDFKKLELFEKVKIIFHVQPFKYKYQEKKTVFNLNEEPDTNSLLINNEGNYVAMPVITITGSGTIEFIVNNNKLFSYTFPDGDDTVVIDSPKQDAYLESILKNRNMSGEFPILESGENVISWEGNITRMEISSQSRWL